MTYFRKLIGARYYLNGLEAEKGETLKTVSSGVNREYRSARDSARHGSHTTSIIAGRYVRNMNYSGLGAGGARGELHGLELQYTKHAGNLDVMIQT